VSQSSFFLNSEHVGKYFVARPWISNIVSSGGRFTASTSQVLIFPTFDSDPLVSGERTTGQILTVSEPSIRAYPATNITHSWFRCTSPVPVSYELPSGCVEITGATSSSYTLTVADEGYFVTVRSSISNTAGSRNVWSLADSMNYGRSTFLSNGTLVVPDGVNRLDVLIVGSGGSGGSGSFSSYDCSFCAGGGGGGRGSVTFLEGMSVRPGESISVVVSGAQGVSSFKDQTSFGGIVGGNNRTVTGGRHGGLGGDGYNPNNILSLGSANTSCDGAGSSCGGRGGGSPTFSDITGQNLAYGGGGSGGSGGRSIRGESGIGAYGAGGGGGSGRDPALTSGLPGKPGVVIVRWITGTTN